MKKSGISTKRKIRRNIIIILLILIFFVYGFTLQTVIYKTESDKITEKIKIVFLSDLHNCFYGGFDQSGLLKRIDKENPDIVIFGGDIIDEYGGTKFAIKLMSETVKKYPCYYTEGNHECSRDDNRLFHQQVRNLGVKVLEGKNSKITVKNQKIN
ncbi:MAG: metallophosphoesterase, partial [Ruminococcus sp.]